MYVTFMKTLSFHSIVLKTTGSSISLRILTFFFGLLDLSPSSSFLEGPFKRIGFMFITISPPSASTFHSFYLYFKPLFSEVSSVFEDLNIKFSASWLLSPFFSAYPFQKLCMASNSTEPKEAIFFWLFFIFLSLLFLFF